MTLVQMNKKLENVLYDRLSDRFNDIEGQYDVAVALAAEMNATLADRAKISDLIKPTGASTIGAPNGGSLANLLGWITPETYAKGRTIGTGVSNPLSGYYADLAAAQVDYPHAVALTDTLDWACVQAALNASISVFADAVLRPGANYVSNRELTAPSGKVLKIRGYTNNGPLASTITADTGFTGFLLRPNVSYDIRDLALAGSNIDGCYLIGNNTDSGAGAARIEKVTLTNADIGIFFDYLWEHPFGLYYNQIVGIGFRTGGIELGGVSGAAGSGESAWTMDNILINGAPTATGIAAPSITVTNSVTATTDKIDWDNTIQPRHGWVVMRSANGTTGWHQPPNWVSSGLKGVATFTATKTSGETWYYSVVRQTRGVSIRRAKAIWSGVIQAEYFGIGVYAEDVNSFQVGQYYGETRDRVPPLPQTCGIWGTNSSVTVDGLWVDSFGWGWVSYANARMAINGAGRVNAKWGLGAQGGSTLQSSVTFGMPLALGSTPNLIVPMTAGGFEHIKAGVRQDNTTGGMEVFVDGTAGSLFGLYNRSVQTGKFFVNTAGEAELSTSRITSLHPVASKNVRPKFLHTGATAASTALTVGSATSFATISGFTSNSVTLVRLNYLITGNDGSNRQAIGGSVDVAISWVGTDATVAVVGSTPAKALQAGTASDPVFTASAALGVVTLSCNQVTSMTTARIAIDSTQVIGGAAAAIVITQL